MEDLKKKNSQYLLSMGIAVPVHLPTIEHKECVSPKSALDVASRICALAYVVGIAYNAKNSDLLASLNEYNLMLYVSEYEKKLLNQGVVDEQDKVKIFRQTECIQALAWCIGLAEIDQFKFCDDDLASKIPFKFDPRKFINNARLRPISEIQAQVDLHYRMHWYVKDGLLNGKNPRLEERVVSERRKAVDWVYGVADNWDDVSLDT